MKVYIITKETRKGDSYILGSYFSFEKAVKNLKDIIKEEYGESINDNFGGDLEKGTYYTEESSYEIITKTLE